MLAESGGEHFTIAIMIRKSSTPGLLTIHNLTYALMEKKIQVMPNNDPRRAYASSVFKVGCPVIVKDIGTRSYTASRFKKKKKKKKRNENNKAQEKRKQKQKVKANNKRGRLLNEWDLGSTLHMA